jgi:uncharacterized protein YbjQ (UPF0145 family)
MGARHDDRRTSAQTRLTAASREVSSYTRLVNDTRRDARAELEKVVAAHGGDGVVVDEITLHIGERECPSAEGAHDHLCEVVITGTSIVSLGQPADVGRRAPLAIMHLDSPARAAGGQRSVSFLEPAAAASPTATDSGGPGASGGPSASGGPRASAGSRAASGPGAPAEPEGGRLDRFLAARAAKRASGPLSYGDSSFRPRRDDRDE